MCVRERLLNIVNCTPDEASIMLPVSRIREWLEEDGTTDHGAEPEDVSVDYTVSDLAKLFRKRPNTIREWIRTEKLEAYLFMNREYRVTHEGLERFKADQRQAASHRQQKAVRTHSARSQGATIDMGRWARHKRAS